MKRRTLIASGIAAALSPAFAWGAGHSWNKIYYRGGTIPARVNSFDWNATLTISPDSIVLEVGPPRRVLRLKPSQVTSLSQGPEAVKRVAAVVALNPPAKPPTLFGLMRPASIYIGIVYKDDNGKTGAVLLEPGMSGIILEELKAVTGKPVEGAP
ncbi:MAG: hypothetical protein LAQ30_04550 [Acidobacteriia bacterium]|nr:hypothetical protein [Terriglobia bacterium]